MSKSLLYQNDKAGQFPPSYYAATAENVIDRPALVGAVEADVCIIGGGFTGLSAALHCAENGKSVVLLDAHRAGWGASGRNGGQAGVGQRVEQDDLEEMVGLDLARKAYRIGVEAPVLVQDLAAKHGLNIGYKPGLLYTNHRQRFDKHSKAYVEKLNTEYDYHDIRFVDRDELPEMLGAKGCFGATLDMGGGHLHPLNFALGLAKAAEAAGAQLFDRSEVLTVETGQIKTVSTATGTVRAKTLLYACNGYLSGLEPKTAARVMPINSFVVATEPLPEDLAKSLIRDDVAVADSRFVVNYYRLSQDRRLLFGGGETYGYKFHSHIEDFVTKPLLHLFPQLSGVKIDYGWGGTLGITLPRLPDFAELSEGVYSFSGYSGSGLAMATKGGQIFADLLRGDDVEFRVMEALPTPPFPGGGRWRQALLFAAMSWYAFRDRL